MATTEDTTEKKSKFTFKCTRCGNCCTQRGNIPLTFWDLELWAKNKVVANMYPHLSVEASEGGLFNLVIKAVPLDEKSATETKGSDGKDAGDKPEQKEPSKEKDKSRCPFYNVADKSCTIYTNRPITCRSFPLEYDGKSFALAEIDCPGVGQGPMSKEELQQIREDARVGFGELRRMQISLPLLHQIISQNAIRDFMEQMAQMTEARMKNLSEDDRRKIEDINQKLSKGMGGQESDG